MPIKEIRRQLLGRTIFFYDGWNGCSKKFVIGYIASKNGYVIYEHKESIWNKLCLKKEEIEQLIAEKSVERLNCIDRCYFRDYITLY